MCFNSSSSSSKATEVRDERVGADNGATAFRAEGTNEITVGSDDTAQLAIESSTNALTATTDLIGSAFSEFLNLTDKRLERADQNIASQNAQTAELISKEQESSDDRLIKVIQIGVVAAVGVVLLQSGAIKDVTGAFK
jgi:hypothetical protein